MTSPAGLDSSGFVLVGLLCLAGAGFIVAGAVARARRDSRSQGWQRIVLTLPGTWLTLILVGVVIVLFGVDVVFRAYGVFGSESPLSRWWFLPPAVVGDPMASFFGHPLMALLLVAILIQWWGVPSLTNFQRLAATVVGPHPTGREVVVVLLAHVVAIVLAGVFAAAVFANEPQFRGLAVLVAGIIAAVGAGAILERLFARYREGRARDTAGS